jgi:hypothetical protein
MKKNAHMDKIYSVFSRTMTETGRVLKLKPTPFDHGFWVGLMRWRFAARTTYLIGDRSLTIRSGADEISIDVADIEEVRLEGADVALLLGGSVHRLRFLRDAEAVSDALRTLSETLRKPASPPRKEPAMASERLNDLVGLWQQGLISEAEYEAEKRHFS